MEIKDARISLLINSEETTLEVRDSDAAITFLRIKISPQQLSDLLSRRCDVECHADVFGLDKLGKKHQNENFEFEVPIDIERGNRNEILNEICLKELALHDMPDWVPDKYYQSQNSFFKKDGKSYARAVIRRWI